MELVYVDTNDTNSGGGMDLGSPMDVKRHIFDPTKLKLFKFFFAPELSKF